MISLFKKSKPKSITTDTLPIPKAASNTASQNKIVQQIHDEFYSEVDRLLAEAKISHSLEINNPELLNKAERLKKLGFTNTIDVQKAKIEKERLEKLKGINSTKKEIIEAISHFSIKYPQYKFITEDSVKKICEKYNLIYGEIGSYKGTVPDKNLLQIEEFKIDKEDVAYLKVINWQGRFKDDVELINRSEYDEFLEDQVNQRRIYNERVYNNYAFMHPTGNIKSVQNAPLEIAAPAKDFDLTLKQIKDFKISKIEIPDPIVLQPVIYNGKKHYLIVTAWGLEASDDEVINQKMN